MSKRRAAFLTLGCKVNQYETDAMEEILEKAGYEVYDAQTCAQARGVLATAGADLINGLVNGVTSKLTAARDRIVSFGSSIKGWFADTLGIKSPSRVFMGFGDNIAQGAAIGIGRSAGLASKAAAGMASATVSRRSMWPISPR